DRQTRDLILAVGVGGRRHAPAGDLILGGDDHAGDTAAGVACNGSGDAAGGCLRRGSGSDTKGNEHRGEQADVRHLHEFIGESTGRSGLIVALITKPLYGFSATVARCVQRTSSRFGSAAAGVCFSASSASRRPCAASALPGLIRVAAAN